MKKRGGLTLIELMFTMAIISIGVIAMLGTFRYITTSIQASKGRTLANNLMMEQIEKLKNLTYYSLLVTTSTYNNGNGDTRFSPPLFYDNVDYPPQTIIQGGITYTRATRVDFAFQDGTIITTTTWQSNDTGLKEITVYVMWQDISGLRYQEMHNLMANPAANPLNSTVKGTVRDSGNNAIQGALIRTIENPNYFATTDNTGSYQFNVSSGTYTLNCSTSGYFSSDKSFTVASSSVATVAFVLTKMSTGTISGTAYLDNHLVVSQVVTSTDTNVEYVELYNPTTSDVNIGTVWPARNVDFYIFDPSNNTQPTSGLQPVPLVYVSTYIASNKYYLISNTPNPIHVAGTTRNSDAYYAAAYQGTHLFTVGDAGGTGIAWVSPLQKIDALAWDKSAPAQCPATPSEGACFDFAPQGGTLGLDIGQALVRMTDPSGTINTSFGRAYDTDNNATNFVWQNPLTIAPGSMAQSSVAPLTGTPAAGAYITVNDLLSSTVQASSTGYFSITNVSTGSWTVAISTLVSGTSSYYLEISPVQMTVGLSTGVPNGATTPAWPSSNMTNALLNNTTTCAFVSGVVTNTSNVALSGISMLVGGKTVTTNASGRYFVSVSSGDNLVVANNGNVNKAYASQSSLLQGLNTGQIYDYSLTDSACTTITNPQCTWFQLPLQGILVGYFQTGSQTALPGLTLVALDGSGSQAAQAVSDNTGHAYLVNLSTGNYTLEPALDPASTVSPTATAVTLSSTGTATTYSTFTVTSGLAQITGQVTASGKPITTGVLIMASTMTLSGGASSMPPTQNGGYGALCDPCYYGGSSDSTGQYTLYVRSSTTPYQVYGWYSTFSGSTSSTTRNGPYSITVSTEGAILSQNIAW